MSLLEETSTRCQRCGGALASDDLACPQCGLFTHLPQIDAISREALAWEQINPKRAIETWERVLDLLPGNAPQFRQVYDRTRWLRGLPPSSDETFGGGEAAPATPPPDDPWQRAVLKTGGSLLLNIPFYAALFYGLMRSEPNALLNAIWMSIGFLLLILVHEMGHVIAMRYYRLSASPPIFIPFVGALINLRQPPKNAKVEAIIGIGGPVLGTIGAALCYFAYLSTGWQLLAWMAFYGFVINLFNMLPVPPLDGGRVTAAVSPWIWLIGLALLVGAILYSGFQAFLLVLVLFFALPRIIDTLRNRDRHNPYYRISRRSSWLIGISYVALTVTLFIFTFVVRYELLFVWD